MKKEDGRTFEEKKSEAIQYLQTQTDTTLAKTLLKIAAEGEMGAWIKSIFWEQGETIRATATIVLRDVRDSDKPSFFKLQYRYSIIKSMLKDESSRELLWKEHISCRTLMCSIEYHGVYGGIAELKILPVKNGRLRLRF